MTRPLDLWAEEDQHGVLRVRYRIERTLFAGRSEHQTVDIVDTAGFGRMLFNDGIAMLSERDERIYHEMIAHVPLFVLPHPRRVLVIGGGDGGTVREVLRHPTVESCRLVEIDRMVVEGCRQHLPSTASALDDPRVEVSFADGARWVAETDETYDLVLVDSTDPMGSAETLFDGKFYAGVHRVLTADGVVVSQANSPFYEPEAQRVLLGLLRERFGRVQLYNYSNLTYPGGLWSFSFAARGDLCPIGDFEPRRVERTGLEFDYYSAAVHRAAFAHPKFQERNLSELLTPLKR